MTWLRMLGAVLVALTMTGCSGRAVSAPAPALPADQMVFTVMTGGGLVRPVNYAMESPSVVIYGDGRVLTISADSAPLVPTRYDLARIDPAAVASFVSEVEAGGVISPGTDFGTPRVTDLATTTVMLNGANGPVQVSAYVLIEQFETELTAPQRSARAALRAIIDEADSLSAGATRSPYAPDRIVVYELDPKYEDEPATIGWPGPPPSSFLTPTDKRRSIACGELIAEPAEVVYQAALTNPGARWLVDGATRVLAVNPLPLADACP